jgi:hypothetical protein
MLHSTDLLSKCFGSSWQYCIKILTMAVGSSSKVMNQLNL